MLNKIIDLVISIPMLGFMIYIAIQGIIEFIKEADSIYMNSEMVSIFFIGLLAVFLIGYTAYRLLYRTIQVIIADFRANLSARKLNK
jgi:hypothetical protein